MINKITNFDSKKEGRRRPIDYSFKHRGKANMDKIVNFKFTDIEIIGLKSQEDNVNAGIQKVPSDLQ